MAARLATSVSGATRWKWKTAKGAVASPAISEVRNSAPTIAAAARRCRARRGRQARAGGRARRERLVAGDQREGRGERHLEARRQQALRRDDQDDEGGERDVAERDRAAVEQDRDEHDREHDEGALRSRRRRRRCRGRRLRRRAPPAAAHS